MSPPTLAWLDALDEPAWVVDAASQRVLQLNSAARLWLGPAPAPATDWQGQPALALLNTLEDQAYWQSLGQNLGRPSRATDLPSLLSDTELPCPSGPSGDPSRWVERQIRPLPMAPGAAAQLLVRLRDRSRERQAEQQRDTALAELRATLEATADGLLVTDLAGRIQAFNRRFAQLWQLPDSALAQRQDAAVFDWLASACQDPPAYRARLAEIDQQWRQPSSDRIALRDGRWLERHSQPQWQHGLPTGRVWSFRLTTAHSRPGRRPGRRHDAADANSPHPLDLLDPLDTPPTDTSLPRPAWLDACTQAMDQADARCGTLALLCIGFDADRLFSQAGDTQARCHAALQAALAQAPSLTGPHRLGQLGGGRLALLLNPASETQALALAERLLAQLNPAGADLPPCSLGLVLYPGTAQLASELLQQAEAAQRRAAVAWRAGQGGCCLHQSGAQAPDLPRQQRLTRLVRAGQFAQHLRLQYQPWVDLRSGQLLGAEALLRWHDREDGPLLPARFLPLAERAGVAPALDDWVLEQTLRQGQQWREQGLDLGLAVNLSGPSLADPGLPARLAHLLHTCHWPAQRLRLDFQEHALRDAPDTLLANLRALHRLGLTLVLDDLGAGDCALARLRRLPLSAVQLDRSLVCHLASGPEAALATSLIDTARHLGWPLWAQGIETEAQRQHLLQRGAQVGQGQHWAAALEPRQLLRWAQARAAGAGALLGPAGQAANDPTPQRRAS